MSKKPLVQIEGKEVDLNSYLTTLEPPLYDKEHDTPQFKARLKIEDYSELGYTISSLIGVCQIALHTMSENDHLNASQKEKLLGASATDILKVLSIAKELIPHPEFELLTELSHVLHPTKKD